MNVNAVSSATSAHGAAANAAANKAVSATNTLNYNDFLSLLMSELQHQDPTQPMDPTQMVSQLATVSEVGQSVQANQTLTSMLTSTSLAQAEQLVGRTLTSSDGKSSGVVASVSVSSVGATATLANGDTVSLSAGATIK